MNRCILDVVQKSYFFIHRALEWIVLQFHAAFTQNTSDLPHTLGQCYQLSHVLHRGYLVLTVSLMGADHSRIVPSLLFETSL